MEIINFESFMEFEQIIRQVFNLKKDNMYCVIMYCIIYKEKTILYLFICLQNCLLTEQIRFINFRVYQIKITKTPKI